MASHPDYPRTRLFVTDPLSPDAIVIPDEKRTHYLTQVLRLKSGEAIALFNGRDGEWQAELTVHGKKSASLAVERCLRPQAPAPDCWLLAALLKSGKSEFVLEKATELGISRFLPLSTRFTIVDKLNLPRLQTIALEAAEQCERTDVPVIDNLQTLEACLTHWPSDRVLYYADESGHGAEPATLLTSIAPPAYALLIGPEGGFSTLELGHLRSLDFTRSLTLGPRILRADTAAIAGLALLQSAFGDWHAKPSFRSIG